jgi:hypothetical protein
MANFTLPVIAGWRRGDPDDRRGTKPSPELPSFGGLSNLSTPEQLADLIVGPSVGDWRPADEVRERFRWCLGIRAGDGAGLGSAFETFKARTRLLARQSRDLQAGYLRARDRAVDWSEMPLAPSATPAPNWHGEDAMANANRKADAFLSKGQRDEVKRLIREELAKT